MKKMTPAERLYVEADACDGAIRGRLWYRIKTLELANNLTGTGVGISIGPALSSWGYGLLDEIKHTHLPYWADLNLSGDQEKLAKDACFLFELRPDIVTISCACSLAAMRAFRVNLAGAELVGNTSLAGFSPDEVVSLFNCDPLAATIAMAKRSVAAGFDGWVVAPDQVRALSTLAPQITVTVKGVRPSWSIASTEDRTRIMTPERAFALGADRIVVGEAITGANDQREAVERTLAEIDAATV